MRSFWYFSPLSLYFHCKLGVTDVDDVVRSREAFSSQCSSNPHVKTSYESTGKLLLIYIWNFHVLSHLLLIYIRKLHWNSFSAGSVKDDEGIHVMVTRTTLAGYYQIIRIFSIFDSKNWQYTQYKTIELECQMRERIMTISALRDNYLRDVISVKYHIDKVRGNSSGVYICNSVVNDLRYGNYIDTNKQLNLCSSNPFLQWL